MSDAAIKVENLGKRYFIGERQYQRTARESIVRGVKSPFKKTASLLRGHASGAAGLHEELWALREATFEVERGEVVGLIGRNGAGKSTLLKILSRITEPTEGFAEVRGRLGSLLEVGTGFSAELTGRENVYLNGAILGMNRKEMAAKFDEVVAFAEVEQFIDTPVKHYSTGMHLRLAFAVAAHLDPDVLLVDEVLAVGDAAFRAKCVGKMNEVATEGRTVLFVSHDMGAMSDLCPRSYCLEGGRIVDSGPTDGVISRYLQRTREAVASDGFVDLRELPRVEQFRDRRHHVEWTRLRDEAGNQTGVFLEGAPIRVETGVKFDGPPGTCQLEALVFDMVKRNMLLTTQSPEYVDTLEGGDYVFGLTLDPNYLVRRDYLVMVRLYVDGRSHDEPPSDSLLMSIVARSSADDGSVFELANDGYFSFDYPWDDVRAAEGV